MDGPDHSKGQTEPQAGKPPSAREKWNRENQLKQLEIELKRRELDIKETETKRARWTNPLVIAVLSAALAGAGNVVATLYSAQQQRDADTRRADQARALEREKAESSLVLEVVKTASPDKAAVNLKFLVDAKLISDQVRRKEISEYLSSRPAGQGVNIPPPASDRPSVQADVSLRCKVKSTATEQVLAAIRQALHSQFPFDKASRSHTSVDAIEAEIPIPGQGKGLLRVRARVGGVDGGSGVNVDFRYQSNSPDITKEEAALVAQMHNFQGGPMTKALADLKVPSCEFS